VNAFVAAAPAATLPSDPSDRVGNDGWFPDLSLSAFRQIVRLDGTVTDPRLREALVAAMLETNQILAAYQREQHTAGHGDLAAVPSTTIDGASRLVQLYRRAVQCAAKADLIERYRDLDSTDAGLRRAIEMDAAVDEQRRNARWAVSELLGQPHNTVELI
jgi:hypothetical protein